MNILINGPAGAGKSVIVRQIMSLYSAVTPMSGGVGGLPRAYHCRRIGSETELIILGNYENSFRDHHGLAQFNRYKADFVAVLAYAVTTKPIPTLCEGGFLHPKRLDCEIGRQYCSDCVLIWLNPPEARDSAILRRGRDLGDESYARHVDAAWRTAEKMISLGATIHHVDDRAKCLQLVCSLIDAKLDPRQVAPHVQNYR